MTIAANLSLLAPRELEAMTLLAEGFAPKIAAHRMGLSEGSYYKYVSTSVRKLGAADRFAAVRAVRAALANAGNSGAGSPGVANPTGHPSSIPAVEPPLLHDVSIDRERFVQDAPQARFGDLFRQLLTGVRPEGLSTVTIAVLILACAVAAGLLVLLGSVLMALLGSGAASLGVQLR